MSNYLVDGADLASVANAIRTKGGTSAQLAFPQGFVDAVEAIETGGGYDGGDFADYTKPVGAVTVTVSYFAAQNNAGAPNYMQKRTGITSLYLPNYNNTANNDGTFRDCTAMRYFVAPKLTVMYNTILYGCTNLLAIDWLGGSITGSKNHFVNCTKLNVMVIRRTASICSLATTGAFNNTPFASGKAGGTLYVPQALIASYQAATNWSTILGYANNSIQAIEGSIYETQYVDGTPIPTT